MITQSEYETFRDNINALIQEYREKFSVPMITDSKEYEETYRKRLLGKSCNKIRIRCKGGLPKGIPGKEGLSYN